MPRKRREFSLTGVYHVIFRGNGKSDIFYDDEDRFVFLDRVKDTMKKYNYEIYSYCLMSNHVHLVIRVKDEILSKSIQNLEVRYSVYFNKKYNRVGHLFQNRFFSQKVDNLNYFLTLCKYVHRNHEKAGIEDTGKYRWSSFKEYLNKETIINKKILLHYYNDDINELKNYTLTNNDLEDIYNYSEYELISKLSDGELSEIISKKFELKNASDISELSKDSRDKIIKDLKEIKGTGITQISRVTRISSYYIKKMWT